MKKALVLAAAMVIGLSAVSFAATQTATFDIYEGWNMVSAPLVPVDPTPDSVFSAAPGGVAYMLTRIDPSSGGIMYDGDPSGPFGGVLLGDGYWLYSEYGLGNAQISFEGLEDGVPTDGVMTDMWISLPGNTNDTFTEPNTSDPNSCGGGWHMIGMPFNHTVCVNKKDVDSNESYLGDRIMFTDGIEMKSWSDAVAANWVDYKVSGYDVALGGGFDVQYDGGGVTTNLDPGRGYWINTYKDNLAMIILANN